MITTCKKCGSKNLYLEPRIKGQDVLTADMVALKCKDCGAWLKWCPKNERVNYLKIQDNFGQNRTKQWQKLKEYLKNQIADLRHIDVKTKTQCLRINDSVNCFRQVMHKMQELEAEDEKISKDDIEDYIFENEQWKESDIICPYCKHKHENEDSEFLYTTTDNYEFECENCGRTFLLTSDFDWWYTTTPTEEETKKILEAKDVED